MPASNTFSHVAVVGAGSVGCYFGGMLARAGNRVTLIGRPGHVDAINDRRLHVRSIKFEEHVPVTATTDIAAVSDADLVLVTVKTLDTESAARALAPHFKSNAQLLTMQNGVDNADRVRAATGIDALAAVVYVAAEMTAPGQVTHSGRGDLIVGRISGAQTDAPERITALFTSAQVPCRTSDQIRTDLWHKLVMNSAYNAISALSRARYGAIAEHQLASEVVDQLIREAVAVANADGITLPLEGTLAAGPKLARMIPAAFSSTAQDIERGKPTEIDSLNGYIVRRGRELGVPTPVNQTVHALVRLLEQGHAAV